MANCNFLIVSAAFLIIVLTSQVQCASDNCVHELDVCAKKVKELIRYKRSVTTTHTTTKITNITQNWDELRQKYMDVQKTLIKRENDLRALENQNAKLDAANKGLHMLVDELRGTLKRRKTDLEAADLKVDNLTGTNLNLTLKLESSQGKLEKAIRNTTKLQTLVVLGEKTIQRQKQEVMELEKLNDNLQAKLNKLDLKYSVSQVTNNSQIASVERINKLTVSLQECKDKTTFLESKSIEMENKYEQTQRTLTNSERELKQAKQAVDKIELFNKNLEARNAKAKRNLKERDDEINALNAQRLKDQIEIEGLQTQIEQTLTNAKRLEAETKYCNERLAKNIANANELKTENDHLYALLKESRLKLKSGRLELDKMVQELKALRTEIEISETKVTTQIDWERLNELQKELEATDAKMQEATKISNERNENINKCKNELNKMNARNKELQKQLQSANTNNTKLEKAMTIIKTEIKVLQEKQTEMQDKTKEGEKCKQQNKSLHIEFNLLQKTLNETQVQLDKTNAKSEVAGKALSTAQQQLSAKKKQCERTEKTLSELRKSQTQWRQNITQGREQLYEVEQELRDLQKALNTSEQARSDLELRLENYQATEEDLNRQREILEQTRYNLNMGEAKEQKGEQLLRLLQEKYFRMEKQYKVAIIELIELLTTNEQMLAKLNAMAVRLSETQIEHEAGKQQATTGSDCFQTLQETRQSLNATRSLLLEKQIKLNMVLAKQTPHFENQTLPEQEADAACASVQESLYITKEELMETQIQLTQMQIELIEVKSKYLQCSLENSTGASMSETFTFEREELQNLQNITRTIIAMQQKLQLEIKELRETSIRTVMSNTSINLTNLIQQRQNCIGIHANSTYELLLCEIQDMNKEISKLNGVILQLMSRSQGNQRVGVNCGNSAVMELSKLTTVNNVMQAQVNELAASLENQAQTIAMLHQSEGMCNCINENNNSTSTFSNFKLLELINKLDAITTKRGIETPSSNTNQLVQQPNTQVLEMSAQLQQLTMQITELLQKLKASEGIIDERNSKIATLLNQLTNTKTTATTHKIVELKSSKSSQQYVMPLNVSQHPSFHTLSAWLTDWTVIWVMPFNSQCPYKHWDNYMNGFGRQDLGCYFMGLELLHKLTSSQPMKLWFYFSDVNGSTRSAYYEHFALADWKQKYRLVKLEGYHGDAGDSLAIHRGKVFTTRGACAEKYQAGWWYAQQGENCGDSHMSTLQTDKDTSVWRSLNGKLGKLSLAFVAIQPQGGVASSSTVLHLTKQISRETPLLAVEPSPQFS